MFRMNWSDYLKGQFKFNDTIHKICVKVPAILNTSMSIMFALNAHRGRFISLGDLLEVVYNDQDPDDWGDCQEGTIRVTIYRIRSRLPEGLQIVSQYGVGYKLIINGESV